jgi:hypothetical protein
MSNQAQHGETNMERFFDDCFTVEAVKSKYRELAKKHHPDLGGCTVTMVAVNDQYHKALEKCSGQTSEFNGKTFTYRYDAKTEQKIMDVIHQVLAIKTDALRVTLIGSWVWVTGDTKPVKDSLKEIGLRWHTKRECWYYTPTPHKGRYSKAGLSVLAQRYGAKEFENQGKARITYN